MARQRGAGNGRRVLGVAVLLGVLLGLASPGGAQEGRIIDPSGVWRGLRGEVSLMLSGDALSFSYVAVFGATAHLCDGAGVAGRVGENEYHFVDEQGTVAFVVGEQGVTMHTVRGIASFCGANWPGEEFDKTMFEAVRRRTVMARKAHFFVVGGMPPEQRPAYVIRGDRVEMVPVWGALGKDWVLARFKGKRGVTVGLIKKTGLRAED